MILVERFAAAPHPMGTFGRMFVSGGFSCFTCENPWANNEPRVSCIPAGRYDLVPTRFHAGGGYETLEIAGVEGRTQIKIHVGNRARDVLGCIVLGDRLGALNGEWAVLDSQRTFDRWWEVVERVKPAEIVVRWAMPEGG